MMIIILNFNKWRCQDGVMSFPDAWCICGKDYHEALIGRCKRNRCVRQQKDPLEWRALEQLGGADGNRFWNSPSVALPHLIHHPAERSHQGCKPDIMRLRCCRQLIAGQRKGKEMD